MTNKSTRKMFYAAALLAGTLLQATPAFAQATRTWVSGVGDDVNPCSRTAPCKTFAGAISKTAAGGEINCLDPAGYGAVTITKSLTIDCHFTEGGVLAAGNGVVVNAASTDVIVLRGLDFFGVPTPTNGVRILVAAAVHIEDCVIRRFNNTNSYGISYQPSGATKLFVSNTTITENGNGATGGGILVQPTLSGVARVSLQNVRVSNNSNGVNIDTTGSTGVAIVSVDKSYVTGNTGNGISALSPAPEIAGMINDSVVSFNGGSGIVANGSNVTLRVSNASITANSFVSGAGVSILNAAQVRSYGDNRLDGNAGGNDGAFTLPVIGKK